MSVVFNRRAYLRGLFVMVAMLEGIADEHGSAWFILGFAAPALSALPAASCKRWPFGLVEVIWALVALRLRRWRLVAQGFSHGLFDFRTGWMAAIDPTETPRLALGDGRNGAWAVVAADRSERPQRVGLSRITEVGQMTVG